jgi:hypothetical protein
MPGARGCSAKDATPANPLVFARVGKTAAAAAILQFVDFNAEGLISSLKISPERVVFRV